MKKIFNLYNISLILVVALIGVLTLRTTEVKATGTITWPNGSTATISRTIQNVYNAPEVDFTYGISTEDSSIIKVATVDSGTAFNGKLKTLANGSSRTYDSYDTRIISFKRANSLPNNFVANAENTVSTSISKYPIYIFFDSTDGTMYYYSEANIIYLNASCANMFRKMGALVDVSGLSFVNTSNVTNTTWMFAYCEQLSNIDALSSWDTSNVTLMSAMFISCSSLANISALSNWNTSKVTNMGGLFDTCSGLTSLSPLSNWDTSRVTNINNMFKGCVNASGTIQILGNPTNYSGVFTSASTASGAQITVNYGSSTSNIDNIIATKSNNSNVVKGSQVSAPSGGGSSSSGGTTFYTKTLSFDGSETVSNSYTVSKSGTIDLSNI